MRSKINQSAPSVLGVVLMAMVFAGFDADVARQPAAAEASAQATRYTDAKWVKLGDLVPMETAGPDVYVRLIAIEDEVLLPVDHVR